MIDFFEPHIAAELENNAAEFSSVQVRFSNECRSEVCLDTNAHMAYEFTVSGGDVVDLIDSSRSVSLYFENQKKTLLNRKEGLEIYFRAPWTLQL